jgi:glycosyltransferase involved in cell wall biosynthesis
MMFTKTLILTPSIENHGGIQRYTRTLTSALQDILGAASVHTIEIGVPRVHARTKKVRISSSVKWKFVRQATWEAVRWRPDLIICTHLSLGPAGWLASRLIGRPYWIVAHGVEAWCELPLEKRTAFAHADRIVVTSSFSRDQVLGRHKISSKPFSSLPCTLDETLLNTRPATNSRYLHLSSEQRVVLTVARMDASERYKGHDVVLHALSSVIRKVENLTYIIVGDGDDRSRLEGLARDLGVTDHVVFTGEIDDSELVALYERSEIFVLPARTVITPTNPKGEGFGIVFLEAMAFGKPVVGPNCGAPAELIRDGQNGLLVDPEDATSVAEALIKLLTNPGAARAMGRIGRDYVRAKYSFGSFRERLREALAA